MSDDATKMLREIVNAYRPQWHYEMGKVGHECAFCGRLFKISGDFNYAANHRLGCEWARARAYLDSLRATPQEQPTP